MVKADLRKTETDTWQAEIGAAFERVQQRSGLSLKVFADTIQRNERQVARWFEGKENPQVAAVFAVPALRQLLVLALAETAGDAVEIQTVVTIRRSVA